MTICYIEFQFVITMMTTVMRMMTTTDMERKQINNVNIDFIYSTTLEDDDDDGHGLTSLLSNSSS